MRTDSQRRTIRERLLNRLPLEIYKLAEKYEFDERVRNYTWDSKVFQMGNPVLLALKVESLHHTKEGKAFWNAVAQATLQSEYHDALKMLRLSVRKMTMNCAAKRPSVRFSIKWQLWKIRYRFRFNRFAKNLRSIFTTNPFAKRVVQVPVLGQGNAALEYRTFVYDSLFTKTANNIKKNARKLISNFKKAVHKLSKKKVVPLPPSEFVMLTTRDSNAENKWRNEQPVMIKRKSIEAIFQNQTGTDVVLSNGYKIFVVESIEEVTNLTNQ
jgi:uncharacterized protein YlzI (FlbEa/FlbD family)